MVEALARAADQLRVLGLEGSRTVEWGDCGAHPPPRPQGALGSPRSRAPLPRLCPPEVPRVRREPVGVLPRQAAVAQRGDHKHGIHEVSRVRSPFSSTNCSNNLAK